MVFYPTINSKMIDLNYFKPSTEHNALLQPVKQVYAKSFSSPLEAEKAGKECLVCHIIKEKKSIGRESKSFKGKASLVAVQGGEISLNQEAVSTKGVNLLIDPVNSGKLSADRAMLELAKRNNVSIGITLSSMLKEKQLERALHFKNLLMLAKLCRNKSLPLYVFSGARDPMQLRKPKDLYSILPLLGFTAQQANSFMHESDKLLQAMEEGK